MSKSAEVESMIKAENKAEAEKLISLFEGMTKENRRKLLTFLEGVKFCESLADKSA